MSDLISREALMEFARNHVGHTIDCNDIARFPSVDAEPVRHGRWIKEELVGCEPYYLCSMCGKLHYHDYNFCNNCGAKMGGAEDEHQGT